MAVACFMVCLMCVLCCNRFLLCLCVRGESVCCVCVAEHVDEGFEFERCCVCGVCVFGERCL